MSRAAMLAAGAVMLGAEACDDNVVRPPYGAVPPPVDAAVDTSPSNDSAVALYGAAPAPLEQAPPDEGATPPATNKT